MLVSQTSTFLELECAHACPSTARSRARRTAQSSQSCCALRVPWSTFRQKRFTAFSLAHTLVYLFAVLSPACSFTHSFPSCCLFVRPLIARQGGEYARAEEEARLREELNLKLNRLAHDLVRDYPSASLARSCSVDPARDYPSASLACSCSVQALMSTLGV